MDDGVIFLNFMNMSKRYTVCIHFEWIEILFGHWTHHSFHVPIRATQEGLTASPWSELAHLSSALDGFEAAIQQAEVSTARNGHLDSEASDEMDGGPVI